MASSDDVQIKIISTADTSGIEKAERGIQDIGTSSKDSEGKQSGFITGLANMAGNLAAVGATFVGYQLVQTLEDFGTAVFKSAGDLEQTNISYQNMIGNVGEANKLFGNLTQYANSTPFTSMQVGGAAKELLAFGQTSDQVVGTVKKLGDVAASGGGDLQAMSLVSGQIFAQGAMHAQDMYQVINDGGAGLIKIMANNAGGMQNLTAEFQKGGVPAQAYFDAINQATDKGGFAFEGAQKQAGTFNGMLSTLQDSATQFGEKLIGVHMDPQLGLVIDKGGLFDRAKDVVAGLTTTFQTLGDKIEPVVTTIMDFGTKIVNALAPYVEELGKKIHDNFAEVLKNDGPFIKDFFKMVGDAFVIIGGLIIGAVELWADQVKFFFDTGQKFEDVWNGVAGFISDTVKNISNFVSDSVKNVQTWFNNLGTSISTGVTNFVNGVSTGVQNAWNAVVTFIQNLPTEIAYAIGFLVGALVKLVTIDIPNFINSAGAWFNSLPGIIGTAVSNAWNALITWFNKMGTDSANSTQSLIDGVSGWFGQLPGRLSATASGLWNNIVGFFNDFKNNIVNWATDTVNSVVSAFESLPSKIGGSVSSGWNNFTNGVSSGFNDIVGNFQKGFSKGFATGGYTGAGGVDEVAGVVHKGEYVLPQSQVDQSTGQPKAALASSSINVTNHIYNQVDYDKGIMQLGFMMRTR